MHSRTLTELQELDRFAYGMPNRPSTPIRTVVNGVYGVVAEFEITNRQGDIVTQKRCEKTTRPSKAHTRASTMAQDQILRTTLSAGVKQREIDQELFKLNKFKHVNARVGKHHVNEAVRRSRPGKDGLSAYASQGQ
uniref:Uncharacterized protein n=1 Tax=Favella ehrenbergii TaxID=182087 RepID=A0A7S3I7F5_9SPIT|mmetsp:Transcript_7805/g.9414  ORF Transcript_7805/g.9414 Transcript_7805/m.9414 type:complete len:136 (+) Transcript_7805:349-756(+)|eukprot:CAMPEP_0170465070 /NCGR_PEP_ID=MMETSP0123-20130129/9556_1 /TAXON_ID=182087 /ORGANISM="Favella ehrenbergii, Strain Fehren 1" /LENGTH=135 /DNA_ID=CAMNT_0010730883 /DNA_START=343 /DNA_END=750 /DNA_ORIENTATION=+